MGKPRLIILIRHAQSEGNKNKAIHQTTPDHRVKLTKEGHRQAFEAGKRLNDLLLPTDTLQIITSPYTRTRETTTGIISSLSSHPNASTIKVYEEPRIREQDFGNFQPCSEEMERMWHERAAYGHFFYRIPNGESAADAYDRVSGFNESLWRQFAEDDFPSVLVLVTHGLMTRIFLMKWYHYSVEYFEDLRNVNHCEFVLMLKDLTTDKYILQNKLRTWSAYKKEQEEKRLQNLGGSASASYKDLKKLENASVAKVRYGGCIGGCNHGNNNKPKPPLQQEEKKYFEEHQPSKAPANPDKLRDKLSILQAGRDFGGSRSGAGSRVASDDEDSLDGGENEEKEEGEGILGEGVGGGYVGIKNGLCSSEPSDVLERFLKGEAKAEILGDGVQPGEGEDEEERILEEEILEEKILKEEILEEEGVIMKEEVKESEPTKS